LTLDHSTEPNSNTACSHSDVDIKHPSRNILSTIFDIAYQNMNRLWEILQHLPHDDNLLPPRMGTYSTVEHFRNLFTEAKNRAYMIYGQKDIFHVTTSSSDMRHGTRSNGSEISDVMAFLAAPGLYKRFQTHDDECVTGMKMYTLDVLSDTSHPPENPYSGQHAFAKSIAEPCLDPEIPECDGDSPIGDEYSTHSDGHKIDEVEAEDVYPENISSEDDGHSPAIFDTCESETIKKVIFETFQEGSFGTTPTVGFADTSLEPADQPSHFPNTDGGPSASFGTRDGDSMMDCAKPSNQSRALIDDPNAAQKPTNSTDESVSMLTRNNTHISADKSKQEDFKVINISSPISEKIFESDAEPEGSKTNEKMAKLQRVSSAYKKAMRSRDAAETCLPLPQRSADDGGEFECMYFLHFPFTQSIARINKKLITNSIK
jgi:hypothetical protein